MGGIARYDATSFRLVLPSIQYEVLPDVQWCYSALLYSATKAILALCVVHHSKAHSCLNRQLQCYSSLWATKDYTSTIHVHLLLGWLSKYFLLNWLCINCFIFIFHTVEYTASLKCDFAAAESTVRKTNPEWGFDTWMPIKTDTHRFVFIILNFIIISFSLKIEAVHPV